MLTNPCPICGDSDPKASKQLEGYQEGLYFEVLFCPTCDTAFVADRKSDDRIYDLIYSNTAVIGGYNRYQQFHTHIRSEPKPLTYLARQESIYWTISKLIHDQTIRQEHRILELGCGLGYLTYALRQEGYNAIGIDISEEAIKNATAYYGPYYRSENSIGLSERIPDRYNVIIMTELIEHLENPLFFLDEAKKLLTPNGILLITTPNKSFLHAGQPSWQSDLPPVHFWWFSEKSVPFIARQLAMQYTLLDFTDYNKKTGNFGLIINDKLQPRLPTFDKAGRVIRPVADVSPARQVVLGVWRTVKRGILPFLNRDASKNQTLAFVLTNASSNAS